MTILKKIEKSGKGFLFFIFKLLLKSKSLNKDEIELSRIKNIIVIRLDRKIGNLILSLPLIRGLKEVFPDASISIFVCRENSDVVKNNPYIKEVLIFEHKKYIKNPLCLLKLLKEVRKRNFDLAIDCSNPCSTSITSCLIAYLSRAFLRVGFKKEYSDIFLNLLVTPDLNKHYIDIQLDLIRIFKKDLPILKGNLYLNKEEKEEAESFFSCYRGKNLIGMWIGGAKEKRWKIENFIELKLKLEENKNNAVFLFYGVDEKKMVNDINYDVRLYEFTSVRKLASFISFLDVFICGDTGPLHISYIVDTPSIGIFLHNNYRNYGYFEDNKPVSYTHLTLPTN